MKKRNKLTKKLVIITIILLIVLMIVMAIQFKLYEPILKLTSEPKLYIINDECSLIMNNMIHQIKNNDDCRIRCVNLCNSEDKKVISSELLTPINSCFECNCYCK